METVAVRPVAPRRHLSPVVLAESSIWLVYILAMVLKCSYFQFSTKLNGKPYFSSINLFMLLSTLTSVLLPLVFVLALFNRKRLLALLVTDIIMSALIFADTMYFRYYYNAITIPVLYQIGLVGSIGQSIKSLMKWKDILFIAEIPLIAAGIVLFLKKAGGKIAAISFKKRITAAIIVFAVSFGFFQVAFANSSSGIFSYDNNYVINNMGIFYFHYYDIKNFAVENIFVNKKLTNSEKEKISGFFADRKAVDPKYKGAAKGKNLIVIQMESMQQFLINRKINGVEITPNLNKFINDSAYFDNFYYQTGGGNTSDAEFLSNTSLYPIKDGSVYFRFPTHTYEAAPKLLKHQGYETYVFHANNPSFWNRTEMYKALGFDHFINSSDFVLDDQLGWGLTDKSMFRQSLDMIDTSKPFYAFLITLTSHHPFDFFNNNHEINVGRYEGTLLGNYAKAAHYVDEAVGGFLDDLKKRGLYDNSVIVVYGDHNAITKDQADSLDDLLGLSYSNYNWANLQKTICFIRFPGMENKGINKTICGEIDILPTVANLMGFEAPHAMGKDMFNTVNGYAVLRNSTVITDNFEYLNTDGNVYSSSGLTLRQGTYSDTIKKYQQQLAISDIILKKDVLGRYPADGLQLLPSEDQK